MTTKQILLAVLAAVVGLSVACGSDGENGTGPDDESVADEPVVDEPTDEPTEAEDELTDGERASAALMAAALEHLVTEDHTFGDGPPPFTTYLVRDRLDPSAGTGGGTDRPLTERERDAITAALAPLGSVKLIEDPDAFRTADLRPTIADAAIVGVGEPRVGANRAFVPVSLWCGGTCGTWLTYQLELIDGSWDVVGIEGPIAIS